MWRSLMTLIVMMWANISLSANRVSLVDVRTGENGERTRIVMVSDGQVKWQNELEGNRLVLQTKSINANVSASQIARNSRLIRKISLQQSGDALKLVFELSKSARIIYRATMKPELPQQKGMRWVIDLVATKDKSTSKSAAISQSNIQSKIKNSPQHQAKAAKKAQLTPPAIHPFYGTKPLVVAIDAGHGGKDIGARGHSGTLEKNITLAMAKELAAMINAQPGMRALLTRDDDSFIPLEKRPRLAREKGADIFISLHADSYLKDKRIGGASFYVMSWNGATSQLAHFVAMHSNSANSSAGVASWNQSLANTIGRMAMMNTIADSERLAYSMQQQMKRAGIRLQHRSIQSANFLVLKNIDMPSVLIEMGFISNPQQDSLLRKPEYRRKLARSIVEGLVDFVKVQPEPGIIYANLRVRRGDSLSSIAARHHINADYLAHVNRLKVDAPLQVGKVLRIPVNVSQRTALLADSRG